MLRQVILLALGVLYTVAGVQGVLGGVTCPARYDPEDGEVRYTSKSRGYGTFATYHCEDGYMLKGPSWQQCGRDGQWTREQPTCEDARDMPSRPPRPHCSKLHVTHGRSYPGIGVFGRSSGFKPGGGGPRGYTSPRLPTTSGQDTETVPCGQPILQDEEEDRVVGGQEAAQGSAPWLVQLASSESGLPYCGGSLISRRWVLTAAHCVYNIRPRDRLVIRLGKYQTTGSEENQVNIDAAGITIHRRYDPYNVKPYNNDIALVELKRDVEYNNYIRPVCLPTRDFHDSHFGTGFALVTGWGDTLPQLPGQPVDPLRPKYLMEAEIKLQDYTTCRSSFRVQGQVSSNMICAGFPEGGIDACQGDSGGPFVKTHGDTWYQIGVVSWGMGCAYKGEYGYYTKVAKYYNWIQKRIGN